MGKEKHPSIEQERKDLTFYYEIIGLFSLIIPILALARLGVVGFYIMLTFRIVFGDWYFLILIALIAFGIRSLLVHKPLNWKNVRTIGILMILIGIMILSHFTMHNFIQNYGTDYLSMTMSLYLDYFKNYQEGMKVGGGIIGALFFYLFYTMFSSVGTVIIVFVILFVGLAFTLHKTVWEFSRDIAGGVTGLFKRTKKMVRTIKYDISMDKPKKAKKHRRKISVNNLASYPSAPFSAVEERFAEGTKRTIANVLNNMNVFYNDITYHIGYHSTSFLINNFANVSVDAFHMKLRKVLANDFLIKHKKSVNALQVEVNNIHPQPVDLKEQLLNYKKLPQDTFIWGIAGKNVPVYCQFPDQSKIFLLGREGAFNFLHAFLVQLFWDQTADKNITIIDLGACLKEWENLESYREDDSILEEMQKDTDERMKLMHQSSVNHFEEYRKLPSAEAMTREVVVITGLEKIIIDQIKMPTLSYLLQVGKQCGYVILALYDSTEEVPNHLLSLFEDKLIFHTENPLANKLLGFQGAKQLDAAGEVFHLRLDEVQRFSFLQTPLSNIELICK
ncbi:MAG TPA: hypothetical protein PKV63_02275 [Bacilli bacterium]|nr:hypothetical protein [Bacilli bacterium]